MARLVMLVCFLLKDSKWTLLQNGLQFEEKSIVKPTFIKGLFLTLNKVLSQLDYYEDENNWGSILITMQGLSNSKNEIDSFIHANPKNVEIMKSINQDLYTYDIQESNDKDIYNDSIFSSPGKLIQN